MREISYNDGQFVSSKLILFFFFQQKYLLYTIDVHTKDEVNREHWLPQQLDQSCFAYLAQCTERYKHNFDLLIARKTCEMTRWRIYQH